MTDIHASSLLLAVIVGAVVTILGGGVYSIRALHAIAHTSDSQTTKLDKITILVDGRYSEVLQELADVKKLLAKQTGASADADRADQAQRRADDQETRVNKAGHEKRSL